MHPRHQPYVGIAKIHREEDGYFDVLCGGHIKHGNAQDVVKDG